MPFEWRSRVRLVPRCTFTIESINICLRESILRVHIYYCAYRYSVQAYYNNTVYFVRLRNTTVCAYKRIRLVGIAGRVAKNVNRNFITRAVAQDKSVYPHIGIIIICELEAGRKSYDEDDVFDRTDILFYT